MIFPFSSGFVSKKLIYLKKSIKLEYQKVKLNDFMLKEKRLKFSNENNKMLIMSKTTSGRNQLSENRDENSLILNIK